MQLFALHATLGVAMLARADLQTLDMQALERVRLLPVQLREWSDAQFSHPGAEQGLDVVRAERADISSPRDFWLRALVAMHEGYEGNAAILEYARAGWCRALSPSEARAKVLEHARVRDGPVWPSHDEVSGAWLMGEAWNELTLLLETATEFWCISWGTSA